MKNSVAQIDASASNAAACTADAGLENDGIKQSDAAATVISPDNDTDNFPLVSSADTLSTTVKGELADPPSAADVEPLAQVADFAASKIDVTLAAANASPTTITSASTIPTVVNSEDINHTPTTRLTAKHSLSATSKAPKSQSTKKAAPIPVAAPIVRSACYSGVIVYELKAKNGVPVMRRKHDAFVNATQILRAAGLPKPARTKVLEKDISMGPHEKIQGGYAGFQGTWVPLDSAIMLAETYKMWDELQPLLEYDVDSGEAEKHVVSKTKRSTTSATTGSALRREARRESASFSSGSEAGDNERPRQTPSRLPRHVPTPPTSARSPRLRRKRLFSVETVDEDDEMHSRRTGLSTNGAMTRGSTVPTRSGTSTPRGTAGGRVPATPKRFTSHITSSHLNTFSHTDDYDRMHDAIMFPEEDDEFDLHQEELEDRKRARMSSRRVCELCGTKETLRWRHGPSKKRSLCNTCGIKWGSGRHSSSYSTGPYGTMQTTIASTLAQPSPAFGAEAEFTSNLSDLTSNFDSEEIADLQEGSIVQKLSQEVRDLKHKLKEMQQGQRQLRLLLLEANIDDRDIDRGFRKVIHAAKRLRASDDYIDKEENENDEAYEWNVNGSAYLVQQPQENGAEADESAKTMPLPSVTIARLFGNESERDRQHELLLIGRFVRAVRRNKTRIHNRIQSMRLPIQSYRR
ncbi:hypothetical protein QVD99_006394 [Batrachochytrium dendrobatidis]|nr:hypothetical protein O5D80_003262 [Batrachochytrium dendrobatidis]KAK5667186.1 hypothetical protein QVD99_006394 [Batrachochytrium dendrobatidis]